jgi:hypothetical protein
MTTQKKYFVEVTDTFGGEANYAWVNRYLVHATTMRGAMWKVGRHTGYRFRMGPDVGDMTRYKARGALVCAFVMEWDETCSAQRVATL